MSGLTPSDVIMLTIIAGLFIVIVWTTVFVMLFGIQRRLDQVIHLLDERLSGHNGDSDPSHEGAHR